MVSNVLIGLRVVPPAHGVALIPRVSTSFVSRPPFIMNRCPYFHNISASSVSLLRADDGLSIMDYDNMVNRLRHRMSIRV